MPELAEVEIFRQNLSKWWKTPASTYVLNDPALIQTPSMPLFEKTMEATPDQFIRRGKHLIVTFVGQSAWLLLHFRMTGKVIADTTLPTSPSTRLAWHTADRWIAFLDARRLGHIECVPNTPWQEHTSLKNLGPEPFDWQLDDVLRLQTSKATLKAKLLDQSIVAGVGNIAITEIFWRLQLHPQTLCTALYPELAAQLLDTMQTYFLWLIEHESGPEIVFVHEGKKHNPFDVYKRLGKPCPRCQTPIMRMVVASRASFYCPGCQT